MVFVNAANKEDKLYVDYAKGFIQLIAHLPLNWQKNSGKQSQQPVSLSLMWLGQHGTNVN